ncbi:hypothetical protein KIPB_006776 [Kipferlia bialata]|uniref:Uncharacterized protein n=1 Tax=Kipferlia bialata TaxID=797122 RepID=A0A9K3CZP6_9EUKA|nr:hypothetical protein KIPB_006776 [Kipferlia bialata]|eukprot:g6776.t1
MMKMGDIDTVLDLGVTTVDLQIDDMHLGDFSIGGAEVATLPETQQIQIKMSQTDIDLTFSWAFQEQSFPFLSDSGTGTASASNIHGTMVLAPAFDEDCGVLQLSMDQFEFDYGDIAIHLDGGASALYNAILTTLIDMFQDVFTQSLDELISSGFISVINTAIGGGTNYEALKDGLRADFRFVAPGMLIEDSFIDMVFTGYGYPESEGRDWQKRLDDGLVPGPMGGRANDEDIQYEISHTVYESIMDAGISAGIMSGVVDPSKVQSPQAKSLLTTSSLGGICPGLYEAYPEAEIYLELVPSAETVPRVSIMPSAAFANITGTVSVSVLDGDKRLPAFEVGYSAGLAGIPSTSQYDEHTMRFPLLFSPYNTTAWSMSSEFGPVDTTNPMAMQLEMMLSALAVVPYMNDWITRHGPYLDMKVSYLDWDNVYPMLQIPESISYCIPMHVQ